MSVPDHWRTKFSQAAKLRNIQFSQPELDAIRNSNDDSELAQWVKHNVNSTHMLTTEELKIWQHIEKKQSRSKAGEEDLDVATHAILAEGSIRHAIDSLETSTKAIEQHTIALERQQAFLESHRQLTAANSSRFRQNLQRKREIEKQQLNFMNVEALSDLQYRLNQIQERTEKVTKSIPAIVNERLNADDRALELLDTTSTSEPSTTKADIENQHRRFETLITALQQITTSTIRDRLDRIYLEELQNGPLCTDGGVGGGINTLQQSTDNSYVHQLQNDLQTLYTEIDDVAAMVIHHQHGKPFETALNNLRREQHDQNTQTIKRTYDKLVDLTDTLNTLATRYECLYSHRVIVHEMQQHLNRIHAQRSKRTLHATSNQTKPESATRTSTVTKTNKHRSDELDTRLHPGPGPALTALLRHLNINLEDITGVNDAPITTSTATGTSTATTIATATATQGIIPTNNKTNPSKGSTTSIRTTDPLSHQELSQSIKQMLEHTEQSALEATLNLQSLGFDVDLIPTSSDSDSGLGAGSGSGSSLRITKSHDSEYDHGYDREYVSKRVGFDGNTAAAAAEAKEKKEEEEREGEQRGEEGVVVFAEEMARLRSLDEMVARSKVAVERIGSKTVM